MQLPRPSLDDLRALRPDLSFALFAMDPGAPVTLEIYHDGHVYPFRGEMVADAILAAFPPEREAYVLDQDAALANSLPATPDSIFD